MNVSIVIPVYNEASHLDACLRAISNQSVAPLEVIVVDNNSTDNSIAVADRYDFVTMLKEPRQGVVHARTLGFDVAQGEIIGRIDADSIVPDNWVETLQRIFVDEAVDATSGAAHYHDLAGSQTFDNADLFFRRRLERQLEGSVYLWGANMAIRKEAWQKIRPQLCFRGDQHEDFDIAIHLQQQGGRVTFDDRLIAAVSSRRIDVKYMDFMRYVMISPKTYAQHGIRQRWHMYLPVLAVGLAYFPARIMHRGYDPLLERFTLRQLVASKPTIPRVDPTTNVA